ncbi:hypothetical protein BRD13_05730, partial [Halobacteriales archaeon SW_5_70_135]
MTDDNKFTTETDSTDASTTDHSSAGAVQTAIRAALSRLGRALAYPATAADQQSERVLMADGGQSDAKVIGHNTDNSGQTVGVWGEVDSTDGCGLATPDDARIEGLLDTNATDFTVQAGTTTTEDAQNVVAGHASNSVTDGAVGATIAGGGFDDGEIDDANVVHDDYGTVGGGYNNQAGSGDDDDATTAEYATVGGGQSNTASARYATVGGGSDNTVSAFAATVGGGLNNTASGSRATVGGGYVNTASEIYATVGGGLDNIASGPAATVGGGVGNTTSGLVATVPGGRRGAAENADSFVWNDGAGYHPIPNSDNDGLSSNTAVDSEPVTGRNTFSVGAQGGVRFITGDSAVTYISGGSTGWNTTSARTAKTNVDPVDPERALAGVDSMEVATWEYDNDGEAAGTTHIGPMAGDFHDAFDVGDSDEHINSVNARGV